MIEYYAIVQGFLAVVDTYNETVFDLTPARFAGTPHMNGEGDNGLIIYVHNNRAVRIARTY